MSDRLLTALNFSAGTGSSAILWMVLRGEIERPDPFLVLSADPGMERGLTYAYRDDMARRCADAGIEFAVAPGPNLRRDLLTLRTSGAKRIDNPPLFTRGRAGKRGQLIQKCTGHYKIAPMDRFIRGWLERRYGIARRSGRIPGYVEKWIGLTRDEQHRAKPPSQKYIRFRYPLIERGMSKGDVARWYEAHGIERPPRSVCNACPANSVSHYRDLYERTPDDFWQAVEVDEAVRSIPAAGVEEDAYFSDTLKPIRQLATEGFPDPRDRQLEIFSCDSGYCFT